MAYRRRPRTKVYDCNFNIGESYYKPVVDRLDRKYSGTPDGVTPSAEREKTPSGRASRLFADLENEGRSSASRLLETNGFEHHKPSRTSFAADDDADIDAEFEATMKRIKAARAARTAEWDNDVDNVTYSTKKFNIADQLLDSVGLNSRTQRAIEDDVIFKQKASAARRFIDEEDDKAITKWTAVRPGGKALQEAEEAFDSEVSAASRARKTRARLQDIDTELEDMAARGAARQKRISDLRALMDETADSSSSSTVKVTKRVNVKSSAEKKQVTF